MITKPKSAKKNAKKWFTGLPRPEDGARAIFSRPDMRIPPGTTAVVKLIADPNPDNEQPFFIMKGHYIDRKLYMCLGEICERHPGLPCHKNQVFWNGELGALHDKKWADGKGYGLTTEEGERYNELRPEADKWKASDYHFYYCIDCTPAMSGEEQVVPFKSCWGDRGKRAAKDKECVACNWHDECASGLKILKWRYNPKGKGKSNGEKMLKLFTSEKRLESIFSASVDEAGHTKSRGIKIVRAPGKPRTADYSMELTDDELEIPKDVMTTAINQAMNMEDAIVPHVKVNADMLALAVKNAEFDFTSDSRADAIEEATKAYKKGLQEKAETKVVEDNVDVDVEPSILDEDEKQDDDIAFDTDNASSLEDHPIEGVRELAKEKASAKKKTKKRSNPQCFGSITMFERGEGPCVICEKRNPSTVDDCERKVEATKAIIEDDSGDDVLE